MATTLSEFLNERARQEVAERQTRQSNVEEWQGAVGRLLRQIEGWVREADTQGLLDVEQSRTVLNEAGLGRYSVPQLEISGFGSSVTVVPRARFTVYTGRPPHGEGRKRADGRVDLTDGYRQVILYRFRTEPDDIWMMDDLKGPARQFDRAAFETVLLSFLK
jgi:hypothetical protein